MVVGDNLGVHMGERGSIVRSGLEDGFHHCFLPAGTSHWSQPLDNLPFALLKSKFALKNEHMKSLAAFSDGGTQSISIVDFIFKHIMTIFTPDVVKSSFATCGVYPFSHQVIMDQVRHNHGQTPKGDITPSRRATLDLLQGHVGNQAKEAAKTKARTKTVRASKLVGSSTPDLFLRKLEMEDREKEEMESLKEVRKAQRESERDKKRKEKEEKIGDRKRKREQKREEVEDAKKRKLEDRQRRTCKGVCGRVCRKGSDWMGCEKCDDYWVCPTCYGEKKVKRELNQHERKCK